MLWLKSIFVIIVGTNIIFIDVRNPFLWKLNNKTGYLKPQKSLSLPEKNDFSQYKLSGKKYSNLVQYCTSYFSLKMFVGQFVQ